MPSPTDAATIQALGMGVEAAREASELKWGMGRLELLVSDDLRAKFLRTQGSWSKAYQTAWDADVLTRDMLAAVTDRAAGMAKAYVALDAAATEAGHRPVAPFVWEVRLEDGSVAALVQTNAEASKVIADGRYLSVYTAAEIGHVIDALPKSLQLAKQVFPGAMVQAHHDRSWVKSGDEIPF